MLITKHDNSLQSLATVRDAVSDLAISKTSISVVGTHCNVDASPCAANWPPLKAAADAKLTGDYTIIMRADGTKQWAYKGRPLYTWKNDKKPGDITSDGYLNGACVVHPT